jgi:DNA-binding NarL/FixJ family response regulator
MKAGHVSANVSKISVVLVDDDAAARRMIRTLIDSQADMQVTGEASDCDDATELVKARGAHVVVAASKLAGTGCADLLEDLRRQGLTAGLIVLTDDSERDEDVLRLVQAGAAAYLRKSGPPEEVVGAIRVVADGGRALEPSALEAVLKDYRARCCHDRGETTEALSVREREVLTLVAEGHSNREIANALSLSHKTVEVHRRSIMIKLHRHRVADLVRYAVREGLVTLD